VGREWIIALSLLALHAFLQVVNGQGTVAGNLSGCARVPGPGMTGFVIENPFDLNHFTNVGTSRNQSRIVVCRRLLPLKSCAAGLRAGRT
jgi:hypothetical protein